MIRKALGSQPEGKILVEDTLRKENLLTVNFAHFGQKMMLSNPALNKYRLDTIYEIENVFKGEKPITEKKWSLSYGRQNIFSRLVAPLYITFDTDRMKVSIEGQYRSSPFSQEFENYWCSEHRENLRHSIKERLLARPTQHANPAFTINDHTNLAIRNETLSKTITI